jgi:hypothetical protein
MNIFLAAFALLLVVSPLAQAKTASAPIKDRSNMEIEASRSAAGHSKVRRPAARCNDGKISFDRNMCAGHGGILRWVRR